MQINLSSVAEKAVTNARARSVSPENAAEFERCADENDGFVYFINTHVKIYDALAQAWIPFALWLFQVEVLHVFHNNQLVVALKARQLGLSWLALAYALWLMIFRPISTVLIFSRRDDEAMYLLGDERLKGMYNNLPSYLRPPGKLLADSKHQLKLPNGSICYAFPTTAGDSYTASLVIVDEADLVPDLNRMMRSVKPTIDAGGKMFLISRSNKDAPGSEFKKVYKNAPGNGWARVFLAWFVHPRRTEAWYNAIRTEILERTGSTDELSEQYPATDKEALAPASLNKRIPLSWIEHCYEDRESLSGSDIDFYAPRHPDMVYYKMPEKGRKYVAGADCAEGLPTSDYSVTQWVDELTGEQVAKLSGLLTPEGHAALTKSVCEFYNKAKVLAESNNHGHAFIGWLNENGGKSLVLHGFNDKAGWTSNTQGKTLMYDTLAQAAKDGDMTIYDERTYYEILSIEKSTLRAPEGKEYYDDEADAFALAQQARSQTPATGEFITVQHNLYRKRPQRTQRR